MARKSKRQMDFEASLSATFNTDSGRRVLAYLKEDYLDSSALRDSAEETYYAVGQQDLIKLLVNCLKDPEALDNIKTTKFIQDIGDLNYE